MSETNSSTVQPGESKLFQYFGEQLPNQVLIQNLSHEYAANYILEASKGEGNWGLYSSVDPGQIASLLIRWPSAYAKFTNNSVEAASIIVGGDGIFPAPSGEADTP